MSTDCDRLCVSTLRFCSTVFENKKTLHTCLDGVWSVCAWYRLRAFQLYFAYVCSRPSETERPFQPCTISLNRSLRDLSLSHTHAKTRRTAPNPHRYARCFLMKCLWLSRLPRPWHCTCSRQARTTKKHGCNAARVPDDRGYPRKQVLAQHSGESAIVQEPGSAAPRARCKSRRRMRCSRTGFIDRVPTKNSVFPAGAYEAFAPHARAQDPNPRAAGSMAAVVIADAMRPAI